MDTVALANDKYRATLRSTFIDGVDTTLSVTAIPTNLPTIVTVGWNTLYETVFRVEGTSGTNSSNYALTGITKIKGYAGNIPENSAVNCLNNEVFFNQYSSVILTAAGLTALIFLDDEAASDTYTATLTAFPDVYDDVEGVPLTFRPNTSNTGAATLNINGISAGDIKKYVDGAMTALSTGDMIADNIYTLVWDGTQFLLQNPTQTTPVSSTDGWQAVSGSWAYASASTVTVPSGAASLYQKGDRVKFTQTTVKYFVIASVADTVLTFVVNTDYTVANAAISNISYSHVSNPMGFPHWFTYSPTRSGWSSSTGSIQYRIEGGMCSILSTEDFGGTSNGTTWKSITLPITPSTISSKDRSWITAPVQDNTAWQTLPGHIRLEYGDLTLVKLGKTVHGGSWTGSGTATIAISFSYQI